MIWIWLACTAPQPLPVDSAPVAQTPPLLEAPRLLRRVSLDLRGVLPPVHELDAVEEDPSLVLDYSVQYMADPLFEERLVQLFAERWWTRVDTFDITPNDYGLSADQNFEFARSIGEEPLRLLAYVIAQDMPWTTAVSADWTRADPLLESMWPLERDPGEGWQTARYIDGRPAAGVLATNGLWWRYTTTDSNMNRSRAAAISRLLLCADYLGRPISFSESQEVVEVEDAVRNDPYCLACHATIDPLAANLFGFWWLTLYSRVEEESYHPERESLAQDYLGVGPGYFGQSISGLEELGWAMSGDPRFYSCAVESSAELLWRRPVGLEDRARLEPVREQFVRQGAHMQPMFQELIAAPEYQAAPSDQVQVRLLSPSQLDSVLVQLTDFEWTQASYVQLHNDKKGYRVLAGGVDGYAVTQAQTRPGLTWALVTERIAQTAASSAVEGGGQLGQALESVDAPRDWIAGLIWQLTAERPSQDELDALEQAYLELSEAQGPQAAQELLLSVLLRDPRFLSY